MVDIEWGTVAVAVAQVVASAVEGRGVMRWTVCGLRGLLLLLLLGLLLMVSLLVVVLAGLSPAAVV